MHPDNNLITLAWKTSWQFLLDTLNPSFWCKSENNLKISWERMHLVLRRIFVIGCFVNVKYREIMRDIRIQNSIKYIPREPVKYYSCRWPDSLRRQVLLPFSRIHVSLFHTMRDFNYLDHLIVWNGPLARYVKLRVAHTSVCATRNFSYLPV